MGTHIKHLQTENHTVPASNRSTRITLWFNSEILIVGWGVNVVQNSSKTEIKGSLTQHSSSSGPSNTAPTLLDENEAVGYNNYINLNGTSNPFPDYTLFRISTYFTPISERFPPGTCVYIRETGTFLGVTVETGIDGSVVVNTWLDYV